MKTPFLFPLITLLATSLPLAAAVDDILANTATFKPKVSVSDVYSDKVLVEREDGFVFRSLVTNPQRIAFSLTANLDGAETGVIDAETTVGVTALNFSHSDLLGNAVDYKPNGKVATFPYLTEVETANGGTREERVGSIVYKWTAKTLTVTLVISDVEAAGVSDIAATDYTGAAEPGEKVAIVDDPIDVSVEFGTATGTRTVFLDGIAKVTTKGYGAETSDDYEEFDLTEVNVKGAADVVGPTVKSVIFGKPDLQKNVSVTGSVRDVQAVELTAVTVNNVASPSAVVTLSDPSDEGEATWSVTGIAVKKGANLVVVTFSDADGNTTKVTKNYPVK